MTKKLKTFINDWIHNTNKFHVIIQTNSPGEVSAWVLPFIRTLKAVKKNTYVTVCLTPCQYASGNEFDVLNTDENVDMVFSPKETLQLIRSRPWFRKKNKQGFIMFFGGDPLYTQCLSLKFGYPCFGYTEHNRSLGLRFTKTFFKKDIGDLMSEKVHALSLSKEEILKKYHLPEKEIVLIFCGSRPNHFKPFFPFMLETMEALLKQNPSLYPLFVISPFISDTLVKELNQSKLPVIRGNSIELMSVASCLITLPGTNTAEAMYMRLPTIAVIPLNRPDLIIFDGLMGLIGQLPFIGVWIKKLIIAVLKRKITFYTHPNRLQNSAIIPEIIDNITVDTLSKTISDTLQHQDQLREIKTNLEHIPIPKDVAMSLVKKTLELL